MCYKTHKSLTQYWIYAQHVVFLSATLSATKTLNPLLGTGFMRSTKRATFFQLLHFQMLITSIITFSMYAVSRTIQNISFNTPYDLTMSIKYQTCKIMRFSQKSSLYTIFWCYTAIRKNNPYSFPGRDFVCLLVKLTFCSHVNTCVRPIWMSCSHVSVNLSESVLRFVPFLCCHNRNLLFLFVYD